MRRVVWKSFSCRSSLYGNAELHLARQIIAERQIDHDQQPDEPCGNKQPGHPRAVADVHEIEDDQGHLGNGDAESDNQIERAKIDQRHAPRDESFRVDASGVRARPPSWRPSAC